MSRPQHVSSARAASSSIAPRRRLAGMVLPLALSAFAALTLACADARAMDPGTSQPEGDAGPGVGVTLWISEAPADGQLSRCAEHLQAGEQAPGPWHAVGTPVSQPSPRAIMRHTAFQVTGADSMPHAWTQRCFQLRSQGKVLAQGAIIPAESARWLAPTLAVLVVTRRPAAPSDLTLGCGWPWPATTSPAAPGSPSPAERSCARATFTAPR